MANLTTDRKSMRKDGTLFTLPVAGNTVIYAGSLVSINAEGYAVPAGDRPGETFAGKAYTRADNRGGANGDVTVDGHRSGVFEFNAIGMTQADLNQDAYVVDDNTVARGTIRLRHVKCGKIVEVVSSASVFVDILCAARG